MFRDSVRESFARIPLLDSLFRRILWSRVHFPERELKLLHLLNDRPFDVVFDVGAALGSYTWVLERKASKVYAFEPGDAHFKNLSAGAMLSRVTVVNAAVGLEAGELTLYTPGASNDARHMATLSLDNPVSKVSNVEEASVRVICLDEFAESNLKSPQTLDLLKIDVEGYENEVLKGAAGLISKFHPIIIAEIEARHNQSFRFPFEFLGDLGYEAFAYIGGEYRKILVDEVANIKPPSENWDNSNRSKSAYVNNFVFQHKQSLVQLIKQ